MRKALIFILIVFFYSGVYGGGQRVQDIKEYVAIGVGAKTCEDVSEVLNDDKFLFVLEIWLSGYITALNSILKNKNIQYDLSDRQDILIKIQATCSDRLQYSVPLTQVVDNYWQAKVLNYKDELTR